MSNPFRTGLAEIKVSMCDLYVGNIDLLQRRGQISADIRSVKVT